LKDVTGLAYYLSINKTIQTEAVEKSVMQKMFNPNPVLIGVLESDNFRLEEVYAYQTMQNHSYRCMSEESFNSKYGMVPLKLAHLQMQAFFEGLEVWHR